MAATDRVYPELWATFRPQRWEGDVCVNLPGEADFNATRHFLQLPLETINTFQENSYDSDDLATDLSARLSHTGPFEVDVDIDEWLEANEMSSRAELSSAELEVLRQRFGVRSPIANAPRGKPLPKNS